ncbi:alpha/beta fold hydrolase [Streptomyces sp. TRM43335]|uniref:Alpha/beta fold hydrolase n=1 Tax=Streptomyces taklimakanensis TaxID=2569853 RepID=A0A6G2BGT1_9ACTN|nr:alpha/beta fold hydrolase [Streptomyces taklimakanensis]MTE21414.1 alpha/beta fold hydrolase [Streptomyces taklimakanensis]
MNARTPSERDGAGPLTLYCLAHAGGSAMPYARWSAFLPPSVRVEPLELPGHGARIGEPLVDRVDRLVDELVSAVRPERGPFALFGHSFGALLAFELARRARRAGTPPDALLVAGRNAPAEPLSHRPVHDLDDDAFVAALRRFGGMPEALVKQPGLLRMYLPALRVDLRLAETYVRTPGEPLDLPIVTFAGRRDVLTDPRGVLAWERETTAGFDLSLLPGGHFFVGSAEFEGALVAALERRAAARRRETADGRAPVAGRR